MAFLDCDEYVTYSTEKPAVESKPVVECRLQSGIVLGQKVAIVPYDHPVERFNGKQCLTSKCISVGDKGNAFETNNTVYVVAF